MVEADAPRASGLNAILLGSHVPLLLAHVPGDSLNLYSGGAIRATTRRAA